MTAVLQHEGDLVALGISRSRDRALIADLLEDHEVVDVDGSVPADAGLCIVDAASHEGLAGALAEWKAGTGLEYAPVLLLAQAAESVNPWRRYSDALGESVDAIQPIPAPKAAIRARIDSLLETRTYAMELDHERRFASAVFESSPVAKTVVDTDGTIIQANARAEAVLGLTESDIAGRAYDAPEWEIVDTDGEPVPSAALPFDRVMDTGEPVYGEELGIRRQDGTQVWLSVNADVIRDEDGEIVSVVSAMEDVTERRRLQGELEASEELHRTTLSNITDTVAITDDDGRFTYVCPNVDYLFGYTTEEVFELGTIDGLLGDDPAPEDLGTGEIRKNVERVVTDTDGEERIVLVTVKGVAIQEGTRLYTVRDVTELVESEQALASERERLETVVSNAPLILVGIDKDATITVAKGRELTDQLGYEPAAIEGHSAYEVFAEVEPIIESIDRVLAGETFATEITVDEQHFQMWSQPTVEDGAVTGAIVVALDITEKVRQTERFQAFVEGSSDIITAVDEAGEISYVSPSVERILGYDPAALVGTSVFDIVHPDDRVELAETFVTAMQSGGGETFTEVYRSRHADGNWRWTETRATTGLDSSQREFVVNTRDVTERLEAERALRETDESRSLALSAADAGVWVWDIEAAELQWHESCEALFGLEPGTFEGTYDAFFERVHPEDREAVESNIEGALAGATDGAESVRMNYRMVRADGEIRWIDSRAQLQRDEAGEPTKLIGVAIDVTGRERRERELERYENIVETASDPIYALDEVGRIEIANAAFARTVGAEPDAIVGSSITEFMDAGDVQASIELIRGLVAGEAETDALELTMDTPDGKRTFEVNVSLHEGIDDETGVGGTVGVARDVTTLRERERELRRAQRAIDASGHAIYITDVDGQIEYVNPAFAEITGYETTEVLGQTPSILKSGLMPDDYFADLWEALLAGETWQEEVINRRKHGESYHALQTMAPILDEAGDIEGFVAIQTDITEHKDRLQQLRVLDRVLRHNLHNDMNVVRGYAEMVAEESTEMAEYADRIITHSDHLLELTDKQRKITEVLSREPRFSTVDLVPVVEHVTDELTERFPEATIERSLPDGAAVRTTDDVERAIAELVENALVHADRSDPTVEVAVRTAADGAVEVEIVDDGPGIPDIERQVVTGLRDEEPLYHGSGLGLWLVAWIVRRSHGALEFTEVDPGGTRATITFPTNPSGTTTSASGNGP